ncbi:hypothetical protein JZU68_07500 [bacterium]|nr:hypothetical protein [bacterium]
MASFNYTVDTQPMADEMTSVSRHVNVTTGAVVAMQVAVIAAEEQAAEHVCENVNRGFYSLIRSQISQKLAKLQSEVDSNLMQLVQQKNALLNIKTRMQRDYNMIAGRYTKLFTGLNGNLKNRVFELDRPTIDFACKEIDKVTNRTKYLTSTVPITQLESISVSQRIIASNVKQRGLQVINSMTGFIHEMNVQKKLTDEILINETGDLGIGFSYIPVAVYECNRDKTDHLSIDVLIPEVELTSTAKSVIKNFANNEFSQLEWMENKVVSPEIYSEFSKLTSASSKSTRINELAFKLFQSNNYLTF